MALANSRKTGKKASFARREHCVDCKIAACFFSPAGRRWLEGSDEGATSAMDRELAPYPAAATFSSTGRRNKWCRSIHIIPSSRRLDRLLRPVLTNLDHVAHGLHRGIGIPSRNGVHDAQVIGGNFGNGAG